MTWYAVSAVLVFRFKEGDQKHLACMGKRVSRIS